MATTNLSIYNPDDVPTATGKRVALVVSEWNPAVTDALMQGAHDTLVKYGVAEEDITVHRVSGSFELIYASARLMSSPTLTPPDCIIALGCIVRGETPHFDYISEAVSVNLGALNVRGEVPVVFGVLTTDTMEQATERAGGIHGNKGVEGAVTALKLMAL